MKASAKEELHSLANFMEMVNGHKLLILFHLRLKPLPFYRIYEKLQHQTSEKTLHTELNELIVDQLIKITTNKGTHIQNQLEEYSYTELAETRLKPILFSMWEWAYEHMDKEER